MSLVLSLNLLADGLREKALRTDAMRRPTLV